MKRLMIMTIMAVFAVMLQLAVPTAHAAEPELVPNPGLEVVGQGSPQGWSSARWGSNVTSFTHPEGGARSGLRSARVDVTSFGDGGATWAFNATPVSASTTYSYSSWYKSDATTEILAVYQTASGSTVYQWLADVPPAAEWTQYATVFTSPANVATIRVFQSLKSVGWVQTDDFSIAPYTGGGGFDRPLISLTFDDGTEAHYTKAFPKLQQLGLSATFYLVSSYTDDAGPPVQLMTPQILALRDAGHEIGSHTVTHPDLTAVSANRLRRELVDSKAELEALIGRPITEFASPFGAYNPTVLTRIKENYASHRTVEDGLNTRSSTDMYQLKQKLILNTTTVEEVEGWIAEAQLQGAWLILTFHDIYPDPGTYDMTEEALNAMLDAVAESGVAVKTVGEARAEVAAQL